MSVQLKNGDIVLIPFPFTHLKEGNQVVDKPPVAGPAKPSGVLEGPHPPMADGEICAGRIYSDRSKTSLSTTSKLRPAVIISTETVHQEISDYTLLFISSVITEPLSDFELLFEETHPDFKTSGLKKKSIFKANKIATVQRELIRRKLGELGGEIRQELDSVFRKAIRIGE